MEKREVKFMINVANFSQERKGELFIFFETLFWSWFPIITIFTLTKVEPLFSLAYSNLIAIAFFAIILSFKKRWSDIKLKKAYKDVFLSSFFIMLLYIFLFTGLQHTTASNMAIILFCQLFFSFLFFNVFKKEAIKKIHLIGAIFLAIGAIIILFPAEIKFNSGDILILFGAMSAPLANHYQKKSREVVSAEYLLFIRTLLSTPILFILAFSFSNAPTFNELSSIWIFLVINGFLLLGLSKIFWLEGIHRISITKASAMTALGPAYTMFFAYLLLNEIPTIIQILGLIPLMVGGVLITRK